MSGYLRNLTLVGVLSIAATSWLLGHLYRENAINNLIEVTVSKSVAFKKLFVSNSWESLYSYLDGLKKMEKGEGYHHPGIEEFSNLMKLRLREFNFVSSEIYALNGNTVYSTQSDRLGENVRLTPGFKAARSGKNFTEQIFQNKITSSEGTLFNRNVVVSYLPINRLDGSRPDGVLLVLTDVTGAIQKIDQLHTNALWVTGGILTLLFLVLLVLVNRTISYAQKSISKIKNQAEIIEHQNYHDSLTGLPNRKLLIDRLQHAMQGATSQKLLLAIMCIDIDRFKNINDTYGFEVGDVVLVKFAERLKMCIRKYDTLSHGGGDNFTLICELVKHVDDISEIADRIIEVITEPFMMEGDELYVTPSIGITIYPLEEDDENELLNSAEAALSQVKREGGNAYKFYSNNIDRISYSRFSMENLIRKALGRDEFVLYYQPFVKTMTGNILGVEALLRWNSPDLGLVNPNDFIPLLEETGMIVPVGRWVMEEACKQGVCWEQKGIPDLKINVNISVMQFHNREIIYQIADTLDSTGIKPHLFCLELTEGILLDNFDDKDQILDVINEMGVSISLDDFGTGYSSMQYLKRIPIDTIKIDRSFIRDMVLNSEDSAIVEAICALARSLRMNVIAEGVETEEQFTSLRTLGVTAVQGYLLSRPLPAATIEDLLIRRQLVDQKLLSSP